MGVSGQLLPLTGQEAGWAAELVWMAWRIESSCLYQESNSDLLVIEPVGSYYADCITLHQNVEVVD